MGFCPAGFRARAGLRTDAQLVLLSAAAHREDGAIKLAPNLKGSAADKVVGTLLTQGLIEEIPAHGALPIWHRDEGKDLSRCASPRAALRPSGSLRAVHCWRLRIATAPGEGRSCTRQACPPGRRGASQENRKRGSATLGQAQPFGLKAGRCARDAPPQTARDHRDHHECNRLATPLGP
jgi:hypothetical protein